MAETAPLVPKDPPPSEGSTSQNKQSVRGPIPLELPALVRLRGRRVILASACPRRRALLAQVGLKDIEILPSSFAEDLPKSLSPMDYVLQTAIEKVRDVYIKEIENQEKEEPAIVIAADTIVVSHFGQILEKPRSMKEHLEMLKKLRDQGAHKVYTAVAVMTPLESAVEPGYRLESHIEETTVRFDTSVTDELILAYVKTREGVDKAGGYGIQGIGSILVERIEGSFDNVVGLPLRATIQLIEKIMVPEEEEGDINFSR